VNIENQSEIAKKFNVKAVPTLLYIKNGQIVDKRMGISSVKEIESKVNQHFK
jgi:thioredoxin 1